LLPLSPTDSIIEGIRCALAYDLPIHGIDLENVADDAKVAPLLFPQRIEKLTGRSLEESSSIATHFPEGEINWRREYAMAARLKALLQKHGSVLFTGGMAHWQRVRALLSSPEVRPAILKEQVYIPEKKFRRVIIDPQTALRFMDLFPAVARVWEECRNQGEGGGTFPDPEGIFRTILQRTYSAYFRASSDTSPLSPDMGTSLDSCRAFEGYLRNLAMLEHCAVPDIYLTLTAARETMDPEYVRVLSKVVMDYPWARKSDFPDSDLIVDSERNDGTMLLISTSESKEQFVHPAKPAGPAVSLIYREKNKEDLDSAEEDGIGSFSWLPWDRLVTTASIRAIASAHRQKGVRPVPFEGNILEGIDVKATVRSSARGTRKLYVREQIVEQVNPENLEGFPVVWIFAEQSNAKDEWRTQVFASHHLRPHVRDKRQFDRLVGSSCMMPVIGYAHRENGASEPRIDSDLFSGMTVYHPTCFTNRQHAIWLEQTGYRLAPIYGGFSIGDHWSILRERFNIDLVEYDWKTLLILSAISYAAATVTVVAPDGYSLDEIVLRIARRMNITVCQTPLCHFGERELERLPRCHYAPCLTLEPVCLYPEKVETAIGERQSAYVQQVPRQVTEYGQFV
jgi:hypothetical protein